MCDHTPWSSFFPSRMRSSHGACPTVMPPSIGGRHVGLAHASTTRGLSHLPASLLAEPPPRTALRRVALAAAPPDLALCLDLPVLVNGVSAGWRASHRWQSRAALRSHYGHVPFDLSPTLQDVRLADFLDYGVGAVEDWPVGLAERDFAGGRGALLDDFEPPPFFKGNLLSQVPRLPAGSPYWLVGSARTGTLLHTDEGATSARRLPNRRLACADIKSICCSLATSQKALPCRHVPRC